MYKRLWRQASLFMGAPFGEPEERFIYRGLCELDEEALGMGHLSLKRFHGGGLGGSSLTGDPGRYAKEVSGYGHLSPCGPLSIQGETGMWGRESYTRDFNR
jgi:hypothetical protein